VFCRKKSKKFFYNKKQLFDTRTPPPQPTASVYQPANNNSFKRASMQSRQNSKITMVIIFH